MKGLAPNEVTYTTLIDGYCRGGKVAIALTLVEWMKENGCEPNIHAYNALMNAFLQGKSSIRGRKTILKPCRMGLSSHYV